MLTYSFEEIGSEALYKHLYKCIKEDIISGKIQVGEKLPSKRSLANHINVSVVTVENAYMQLVAEGYIYSKEKSGYFVSDLKVNEGVHRETDLKEGKIGPQKKSYLFDFATNNIAHEHFPFNIWSKLMRETLSRQDTTNLLRKTLIGGEMELREAISKHLYDFRGMQIEPQQIIVGAGTEYLYQLIIQLLGRNHIFAIENPGYMKLAKIYKNSGVSCKYINMDESGVLIKDLEESTAQIIHISPSHHYPTGIVMPINRRYDLLSWAASDEKRYIIEDDYDCEYRLAGRPIPTLQSIDVMEKVIYMNTFSKSLAPSFRISYMVLPKSLLKQFYEKLGFYACTVSNFEQYTLARFISEGYFEKHINRMRQYYSAQRDRMIKIINESKIAPYVSIHEEDAGVHFLIKINKEINDEVILNSAKEKGVMITCLSQYYAQSKQCQTHELVVNYAGIDKEHIEEATYQLCKALEVVIL